MAKEESAGPPEVTTKPWNDPKLRSTFIFLNFASGLVLYWLTNNVLAVSQQFITDRFIFKKPTFSSLVSPAAEAGKASSGGDGGQGGSKKKNKKARKKETDHPVEP